ncbi:MAG: Gfo/Idh/MocA family oxidoreductase [Chitinophagales bacterium]|nr:Gfo/Idh/MocA family oxidoreductase [Chitinophagales bacterium]MCO5247671.1 Gfo/Idh/MocA family oxidoreductase [Chitinophagales bacterium]MCZ2394426.1 Gfo/Idh/MocA family oxidoreductase [Chitinophagales bacterium]
MQRLKVGIIGIGRQGSIHLEYFNNSSFFELIGCYDKDIEKLKRIQEDYNVPIYQDFEELINHVDVIDIVTPANSHFRYAKKVLLKSKHLFIQGPITEDISEAKLLTELAREANIKVQIGHIERFNPIFTHIQSFSTNPLLIETHRIAMFNSKKLTEFSVFQLIINDIDLILNLVNANIKYIHASGVTILGQYTDTIFARIEFDNGCVAHLNAGYSISHKQRTMTMYEHHKKYEIDFIKQKADYTYIDSQTSTGAIPTIINEEKKFITFQPISPQEYDTLKYQMDSFAHAIINDEKPIVNIDHGYKALEITSIIMEKIKKRGV